MHGVQGAAVKRMLRNEVLSQHDTPTWLCCNLQFTMMSVPHLYTAVARQSALVYLPVGELFVSYFLFVFCFFTICLHLLLLLLLYGGSRRIGTIFTLYFGDISIPPTKHSRFFSSFL